MKQKENIFKPPKKKYYLGKIIHGTPYFNPINFESSIINVRKLKIRTKKEYSKYIAKFSHLKDKDKAKFSNLPMVRRNKHWIKKIFNTYYFIEIGYPFAIKNVQLGWKDKYGTPRFEWVPSFQVYLFKWQFCIFWNSPDDNNDLYYEMILWYLHYSNKDIIKAKETWGWENGITKESTWNDKYLNKSNIYIPGLGHINI